MKTGSWSFARAIALAVCVTLCASCGRRDSSPQWSQLSHAKVGDLEIAVLPSPPTPTQGDNRATVLVRTRDGAWVRGARVQWVASMPAMGAMPYMESRTDASEKGEGAYLAKYSLAMGGEWDVAVNVQPAGAAAVETHWKLRVGTPGISCLDADSGSRQAAEPGNHSATATGTMSMSSYAPTSSGAVHIDRSRWDALGIRIASVESGAVSGALEAVGTVTFDESQLTEVAVRFGGRVRELSADHAGAVVRQGEPLCVVSSPELVDPELEFITAAQAARVKKEPVAAAQEAAAALRSARRKLVALDVPEVVIDSVQANSKPISDIAIPASTSGIVTEKSITRGSLFSAGQMLFRIAPLDLVWIVASVTERIAPQIALGDAARIEASGGLAEKTGYVTSVAPSVDAETRTLQVRISCPNADGSLRPGMSTRVRFARASREGAVIPSAALFQGPDGPSVFVADSARGFEMRAIRLGARSRERIAVLSGLSPGESVVVQGQFLISAEQQTHQGMRAN